MKRFWEGFVPQLGKGLGRLTVFLLAIWGLRALGVGDNYTDEPQTIIEAIELLTGAILFSAFLIVIFRD